MKKLFVVAVFCFLLVASLFTIFFLVSHTNEFLDVFVGIDVAYDDLEEIKALVDETCSYTNTIVIGSTGIT
ncbi:MAG: hypothetical protein PVI43_02140, partial [Candidatus Bathyarchaeota archaeon]